MIRVAVDQRPTYSYCWIVALLNGELGKRLLRYVPADSSSCWSGDVVRMAFVIDAFDSAIIARVAGCDVTTEFPISRPDVACRGRPYRRQPDAASI
jgi:hypothetical protein